MGKHTSNRKAALCDCGTDFDTAVEYILCRIIAACVQRYSSLQTVLCMWVDYLFALYCCPVNEIFIKF